MRTGWPSGSRAGEQRVDDRAADDDDLRAARRLRRVVMKRPALDADVADVEQRRLRAVDRRVLELAAAGADVGRPLRGRGVERRGRPATLSRKRTSLRVMFGIAFELVGQLAAAQVAGREAREHERVAAEGARARRCAPSAPGRRAPSARSPSSPPPTAMASAASAARSGLRADASRAASDDALDVRPRTSSSVMRQRCSASTR